MDNEQRRFLGVPYDLRRPTIRRFRERWWNSHDPRVIVPKPFGWGWDVNLGALPGRLRNLTRTTRDHG